MSEVKRYIPFTNYRMSVLGERRSVSKLGVTFVEAADYDALEAALTRYRDGYQGSCITCEPVALKNQELEGRYRRALDALAEAQVLILARLTATLWTRRAVAQIDAVFEEANNAGG